jgi:hypothetical protein
MSVEFALDYPFRAPQVCLLPIMPQTIVMRTRIRE